MNVLYDMVGRIPASGWCQGHELRVDRPVLEGGLHCFPAMSLGKSFPSWSPFIGLSACGGSSSGGTEMISLPIVSKSSVH